MKLNNFGIRNKSWGILLKALESYKQIDSAVIFGSRAIGNYKSGSDIDIAIYGENVNTKTALDLNAKLNEELPSPYFYDVVVPELLNNPDLVVHIDRVGKVFYQIKPSVN